MKSIRQFFTIVILALICVFLLSTHANASEESPPEALASPYTLGVHTVSHHWPAKEYNNENPGLYVKTPGGWTAGFYFNSENRWSVYAGKTWETPAYGRFSLSATAGAITGYRHKVMPLLAPSVNIRITEKTKARVIVLPKTSHTEVIVAHLTIERSF